MNPGNNPFANLFGQQTGSGNINLFSNNNNSFFGPNSSNSPLGTTNNFNLFKDTPGNPNSNDKKENNKDINPFMVNQDKTSNNDKDKEENKVKNDYSKDFEKLKLKILNLIEIHIKKENKKYHKIGNNFLFVKEKIMKTLIIFKS